jgi:hypothetical protein
VRQKAECSANAPRRHLPKGEATERERRAASASHDGAFELAPAKSYASGGKIQKIDRGGQAAMKLNVKAFALACAILWGFGLFLLTWWIIAFYGATGEVTLIGRLYRGYTISPIGSLIGLVWGFVDALVGGAIFAWLYNRLAGGSTPT